MSVRLVDVLEAIELEELVGDGDIEVVDVVHDSRQAAPGVVFCCLRGLAVDGHRFAGDAVAAGASALLVDHRLVLAPDVSQAVVTDTRAAMGPLAAAVHRNPSSSVDVVGITGTNGKTTVTTMLGTAGERLGQQTAVIGTLSGARTTPEASDLQRMLAARRDDGTDLVAMEVSSHALDLHRVDGTRFAAVAFTNLSPDHLDHHGTMEEYFAAKAQLFDRRFAPAAVVVIDHEWGRRIAERARRGGMRVVEVSGSDATDLELGPTDASFRWRGHRIDLALGGRFNVVNALVAAELLHVLGHDAADVAAALSGPLSVAGRFEPVQAGQPFAVIVDYAHTPDGLEQVLRSVGETAPGAVRVLFGCGGDRDVAKRPLMGAAAARLADHVVLTSDNSRNEPTDEIIRAIRRGAEGVADPRATTIEVIADRRRAIEAVLAAARSGDVVVLAGKGHETTQTIGSEVVPFDDRQGARAALSDLGGWPT